MQTAIILIDNKMSLSNTPPMVMIKTFAVLSRQLHYAKQADNAIYIQQTLKSPNDLQRCFGNATFRTYKKNTRALIINMGLR